LAHRKLIGDFSYEQNIFSDRLILMLLTGFILCF